MNQILSFQTSANGRKILLNYVKTLCKLLIVFAVVIIVKSSWDLYNNLHRKLNIDTPELVGYRVAEKTRFEIKSTVGIKEIAYKWRGNDDSQDSKESIIKKNGEFETSFEINNRFGINNLMVRIVDSKGYSIKYDDIKIVYGIDDDESPIQEEINENPNENTSVNDSIQPTISLEAETECVVITATDNVKMSHVVYRWNDEEEYTVEELSEDEKSIVARIEAKKGDNVLNVKAIDENGNVKEISRKIRGTDGPEFSVNRDEDKIIANITGKFGLTKIEYNFNGEEKVIDNIEGTTYELTFDLIDGENLLCINAYEGNVKSVYKGKTNK